MELIILFTALSIINVIFSTIRSIVLVKGNKIIASIISGGYYAFYNIMLLYTVADFPMWQKCLITFGCNLVGVFIVKFMDEKLTKDKLWKVDFTVYGCYKDIIIKSLDVGSIPYYYNEYGKHIMFSTYCQTQEDSKKVAKIVKAYEGKYFISESKGELF